MQDTNKIKNFYRKPPRSFLKLSILLVLVWFVVNGAYVFSQEQPKSTSGGDLGLPMLGVRVIQSQNFVPPMLRGLVINPDQPFRFDFILDSGHSTLNEQQVRGEAQGLIKYFLASLSIPEEDLWVNLSPYEKDRIIPEAFGQTAMGRDLLAQDYLLKQLTSSLMHPEYELGEKFWDKVYAQAYKRFGTTDIPVDTFNKVWIVSDKARVYENGNRVFVIDGHLKVMLQEDYLAEGEYGRTGSEKKSAIYDMRNTKYKMTTDIIREIIIPIIEQEVNEGKNFAKLRQIYNSLILAAWYKKKFKASLINQKYSDQKNIEGITIENKGVKNKIYERYLISFRRGTHDLIKEDYDTVTGQIIPRKYFSGGIKISGKYNIPVKTKAKEDFKIIGDLSMLASKLNNVQNYNNTLVALRNNVDEKYLVKLHVVNGAELNDDQRKKTIESLVEWLKYKNDSQVRHWPDVVKFISHVEYQEKEEMSDVYFVFSEDKGAVEGWADLNGSEPTSIMEIAPWNRSVSKERKYSEVGTQLRVFAIQKLIDKFKDELYKQENLKSKIITLGHKDKSKRDEFKGKIITEEVVDNFFIEQRKIIQALRKKYKVNDHAMISDEKYGHSLDNKLEKHKKGGIDLNPQKLQWEHQGESVDAASLSLENTENWKNIEVRGLVPFIFEVMPINNLPFVMRVSE